MAKRKIKMEVGKRYKGYGLINEYGEYMFEPCQVESNPRNMHILKMLDGITVYESDRLFKVSIKIPKGLTLTQMVQELGAALATAAGILRKYI